MFEMSQFVLLREACVLHQTELLTEAVDLLLALAFERRLVRLSFWRSAPGGHRVSTA